jgi:hypothetical protein
MKMGSEAMTRSSTKAKSVKLKKYEPPEIKEVWDEQVGMRGVYLLELG